MNDHRSLRIATIGIFAVSSVLFMYEVILTRMFSALLAYNYVFIVASIAILGLGAGAMYFYQKIGPDQSVSPDLDLKPMFWLSLAITGSMLIMYKLPFQPVFVGLYGVLAIVTFALGGMFLASAFRSFGCYSYILYFADLLGAGLGAWGVVLLMDKFGPLPVVLYMSTFIMLIWMVLNHAYNSSKNRPSSVYIAALVVLLLLSIFSNQLASSFTAYTGVPKMIGLFKEAGNTVQLERWAWDSLGRTDVIQTMDKEEKIILLDGWAAAPMLKFNGNFATIQGQKTKPGYLSFVPEKPRKVLIIGSGGGNDIILAKLSGSNDITAIEINRKGVEAARQYKAYNGNVYGLQGVKTVIQDGRSFIASTQQKYDVIYLSLVMNQSAQGTGLALSENYLYTREAVEQYLEHLNPDGRLAFVLHGPTDLLKLYTTLHSVLKDQGVSNQDISQRLVMAGTAMGAEHENMIHYPLLLYKKNAFTLEEQNIYKSAAINGSIQAIYLPTPKGVQAIEKVERSNLMVPTSDNRPFFFNESESIPSFLYILLASVLVLGIVWIKLAQKPKGINIRHTLIYFGGLGAGFILIELALIQRFVLILGHPTVAFTVVVASLLIGGGLGSLMGQTSSVSQWISKNRWYPVLLVAVVAVLTEVVIPGIFAKTTGSTSRIIATIITLLPLSMAMGIPFPTGMAALQESEQASLIPLAWGVNGWFSVIGSILTMMIAITLGYNWVLYSGALVYAVLAVINQPLASDAYLELD
ncbi:MAG: hypothetical protein ACM3PP_08230 [Candidatus Saccharibacteria bacterium]